MEQQEVDKSSLVNEDGPQLNRARSFKSKQLVRSQALREAQSPPRTISPCVPVDTDNITSDDDIKVPNNVVSDVSNDVSVTNNAAGDCGRTAADSDVSSHSNGEEATSGKCREEKKQHSVEIQITSGTWDDAASEQRVRRRWTNNKPDWSRELLSNNPMVACVCGACACPQCRGRRRQHQCPTKQDSGIVCSDDCPDCSDCDHSGPGLADGPRKWRSADAEFCSCGDRRDRRVEKAVSADSADDKSELTGADLVQFLKDTLNKNARDRVTLLKIEKELHSLVNDKGRCVVRFPVMTSYGRMLVHRCAALFQLAHRLDASNKTCVVVSKTGTSGGRIPCTSFKEWCTNPFPDLHRDNNAAGNAKFILKRATQSLEEGGASCFSASRSRSLQQRELDYERVRSRIFSEDTCEDESQWPWLNSGPVKLLTPDPGRKQLLKVQSLESAAPTGSWRAPVCKSRSFSAGDPPHTRQLSRQGDLASSSWRLSPSSSGYKTLSLRSTDSVTPEPTSGTSPEPTPANPPSTVVWAVTDLSRVPAGALVIHPQSGRPLTNPDGSLYHFDPANPPVLYDDSGCLQEEKVDPNNDRRRGRLEKQHSFIDTECDCQSNGAEDSRSKCCCGHQKTADHVPPQRNVDKPPPPTQPEPKPNIKPPTPAKTQPQIPPETPPATQPNIRKPSYPHENQKYEKKYPTNQRPPSYDAMANQKQVYDAVANQNAMMQRRLQEGQEVFVHQQGYVQYRNDEMTSPPQMLPPVYMQPDMTQVMLQQKLPVLHDPNLRPMALTNMVYPSPVAQAYPYVNQYRTQEPTMQPAVYAHPHAVPHAEDAKPAAEQGFRIDPSYPYPAVDYSQCGACAGAYVDPGAMQHQHRPSYNVAYGQMDMPSMVPPAYPHGMVLQQPHYTYGDAMQWPNMQPVMGVSPKVLLHEVYPYCGVVCPPQMVPQYPVCVTADRRRSSVSSNVNSNHASGSRLQKRSSVNNSNRNTPSADDRFRGEERKPYPPSAHEHNLSRQNSSEIQAKIQQIKEQMAQLSARDREKTYRKPDEGKRRENSSNGLLGSYPAGASNVCNGRVASRAANDESQLSTTARAIVDSIRSSMQARNHYQSEYRPHYKQDARRPPAPHAQVSQQTWCRRSPAAAPPSVLNNPRRAHPNTRNERR